MPTNRYSPDDPTARARPGRIGAAEGQSLSSLLPGFGNVLAIRSVEIAPGEPAEPPPIPLPIPDPRPPGIGISPREPRLPGIGISPPIPVKGPEFPIPVPKVPPKPKVPAETACECELEVTPDISLGRYTGVFKLIGAVTRPGPYVIYSDTGLVQFLYDDGALFSSWQDMLTGDMRCGDQVAFIAATKEIAGLHKIIGRWGTLECEQIIGAVPPPQPGKCVCWAGCVDLDEKGELEVSGECELEVLPGDPDADPPVEPSVTSEILAVVTLGDPSIPVTWGASAISGYVSILPACAEKGCDIKCGDVNLGLITPTDAAIAELDAGATEVFDAVRVWSTLPGDCGLIKVRITGGSGDDDGSGKDPRAYLVSTQLDGSRTELMGVSQLNCEPCQTSTEEQCEIDFKNGDNLTVSTAWADAWNEGCLPPRVKKCLVEMCRLGWSFESKAGDFNEQVIEVWASYDRAWGPGVAYINGPYFVIKAYYYKIAVARVSWAGAGRDDEDVCLTIILALRSLAYHLLPSTKQRVLDDDNVWKDQNIIARSVEEGDQSACYGTQLTLKCLRRALAWVGTKKRNWRIIDTFGGENLKQLWKNVKYNCLTLGDDGDFTYSAYAGGTIVEADILAAIENTKGVSNADYKKDSSNADDVFVYFGHVYSTKGTVGLEKDNWAEPLEATKFKAAAAKLTGVVICIGCQSDNLSRSFKNASVKIMINKESLAVLTHEAEGAFTGPLVNAISDVDPLGSWLDLLASIDDIEGKWMAKFVHGDRESPYGEQHWTRPVWP